jgi:hypothetical protein
MFKTYVLVFIEYCRFFEGFSKTWNRGSLISNEFEVLWFYDFENCQKVGNWRLCDFKKQPPTLVETLGGYINGILMKHWENAS